MPYGITREVASIVEQALNYLESCSCSPSYRFLIRQVGGNIDSYLYRAYFPIEYKHIIINNTLYYVYGPERLSLAGFYLVEELNNIDYYINKYIEALPRRANTIRPLEFFRRLTKLDIHYTSAPYTVPATLLMVKCPGGFVTRWMRQRYYRYTFHPSFCRDKPLFYILLDEFVGKGVTNIHLNRLVELGYATLR